MVNLELEDLKQLVTLLKDLPELASERSRQQMLQLAGLQKVASMIDCSGSAFTAINEIVNYLSKFGRLSYDHEALGLFLNTIKEYTGIQQKDFLDLLLLRYDMMTPVAMSPAVSQWKGTRIKSDDLEKIIGENTLKPISFLHRGIEVSRAVAYIGVFSAQNRWSGTGFLISPNLLLTNHHVLPSPEAAENAIFRFNYEEDFQGRAQPTEEYEVENNGIFHSNEELDYTIIQLTDMPGDTWGYLPLNPPKMNLSERINIIQHPSGRPKEISLQNNFIEYIGGGVVQYITSTLPGSSGSPVFNDHWEVIALHHAGGNIPEPTTQRFFFRNEGILVKEILADLPDAILKRVSIPHLLN